MAGSYEHIIKSDGTFDSDNFIGMVENLGDAYEACEHMHAMIHFLAKGDTKLIEEASLAAYKVIRER